MPGTTLSLMVQRSSLLSRTISYDFGKIDLSGFQARKESSIKVAFVFGVKKQVVSSG